VGDALRAQARDRPFAVILDEVPDSQITIARRLEYATLGGEPVAVDPGARDDADRSQRRQGGGRTGQPRNSQRVLVRRRGRGGLALTAALLQAGGVPPLRALRQDVALEHGHPMPPGFSLTSEIQIRARSGSVPTARHFLDTRARRAARRCSAPAPWLEPAETEGPRRRGGSRSPGCARLLGDEFDFSRREIRRGW